MGIQDLEERFNKTLKETQMMELGPIPEGVDTGEDMSLQILLRRGSMTEVSNK